MPNKQYALTLEDMQLERSQQAFFGQYGSFAPADTAGRPVRAAVSLAQGMNTESVARDAAAARALSLPVETVRSNPQETREELDTRRVMQDEGMASFASRSPEHAALIVDDPDAWEKVWRQVRAMPQAIGQAWDMGQHDLQFAALGKEFVDAPEEKLSDLRQRMAAHRKERQAFMPVESYADELFLTTAVEQLPRMSEMLPKQAAAASLAGLGGAVVGSILPGPGTVTAATSAARAGWLGATAYTAFESERDFATADFALLQDEDGNFMSRDDVVGAATIYAAGAAAIETAGEAFFLSLAKPFLGSLASKIAPKAFLKTAVQRAMQQKSTRAAVLDIAKRWQMNALGEGGEEALQGLLQDVMQVVAMGKSDEAGTTSFGPQTVFKAETLQNLGQNALAGYGAGLWLGGVPMITLGAQDIVSAHRAGLWADEQKKLHAQVEATKVKAASPELTQAMLEEGPNLEGNAIIPADALMELHQQDEIILQNLGWEEKAVQQAAELGQELVVPLARLHATLDQNQADAVLDIAREAPQAMSAAEARRLTDRLRTMGERAIAETAGRTEELRARDVELERLREEMTRAVDSVPGLRARLESGEGLQGEAVGVAQFVEDNLRVAVGMARYLADETGRPIAEFLKPITYEGLDVNSRGQLVPLYKIREEMESEEERARAETDRPFWELVWGRVDPESLMTDYAETYKELRKTKRGLFMPAGRGGVPLDQIADELNERGIFTGSADDLLERLKTMERPRRGYYQEGLSLQQTGWHGSGVDFDRFDFSHIGEGEGHQVHGWGGYFAATKAISDKRYRERLAKGSKFMVNGKRLSADDEQFLSYRLGGGTVYAAETSGDFTKLREEMRSLIDHYRNDRFLNNLIDVFQNQLERIDADPKLSITKFLEEVPSNEKYRFETIVQFARFKAKEEGHRASIADVRNQLVATMTPFVKQRDGNLQTAARLESFDIDNLEVYANQGQLFEVDIPEEEEMLNEQATFADQPEKVKNALEKMGFDDPARIFNWNENRFASPAEMKKLMADDWRLGEINKGNDPYNEFVPVNLMQGKLIYKYLKKKHRGAKPASLALLKHGVQGISYKGGIDGQAWVVFDDKKVQIVDKLYQRAFHGSPHRFMKFMLEHIGSGEGNQAYGWGLYFAQDREVAERYRRVLTGEHNEYLLVGGRRYWLREDSTHAAWIDEETGLPADFYDQDHLTRMYHKAKGAATDQEYLAAVEEWLQDDQYDAEQKAILRSQRDEYLNADATIEQPGQVYEVNIPENDVLLHADKSMEDQPEIVKKAAEALLAEDKVDITIAVVDGVEYLYDPAWDAWTVKATDQLITDQAQLERLEANRQTVKSFPLDWKGEDFYDALTDKLWSDRAASIALNEAGVKGLTYVGGQDGRSFVIFDDQAIDMLDTFYQFIGEEGAARLDRAEEASVRMDNLAVAREMEEAGKDAAAIKLATGWERGADGKWRYEIDDSLIDVSGYKTRKREDLEKDANFKAVSDALWMKSKIENGASIAEAREAYRQKFGIEAEPGSGRMARMKEPKELLAMYRDMQKGPYKLRHFISEEAGRELFAAYPNLADVTVEMATDLDDNTLGYYSGGRDRVVLNEKKLRDPEALADTLVHEVQHAIQAREGFASGGNMDSMASFLSEALKGRASSMAHTVIEARMKAESTPEYIEYKEVTFTHPDFDERLAKVEATPEYQQYLKLSDEFYNEFRFIFPDDLWEVRDGHIVKQDELLAYEKAKSRIGSAHDFYKRIGGEVEARNTAKRRTMTYAERLASLATETEDVARKDQIFLRDALGQAMAMSEGRQPRTKAVTRGETVFTPNAMGMDYVVRLFRHANLSTLAHESSHVFFLQMKQLVDEGQASPRMQADYAALCRWVGSKDGYLTTDQHEKLARGMELFLREGKAPSKKLEGAFGRFRRWLTEVYKAITGPYFQDEKGREITLNPEVREVFSRILATQEEVARQAADEVIGRDFTAELDRLGVTGAQRVAITGLVKEAKDMAETRLHEAREAGRKAMQAKWRKEAEKQVEEERIYKARRAMRNSGMNMVALASVVGNEAAGEFFRRLPGIKRDGANPWAFAASFGYDSVDQMVQEMLSTPSKAERVAQLVAEKQAEHDKQFKAQSLIASDQAAAMEEMVQEHIIKAMGGKERGVALAQIKQAAREYLAGLPMDEAINSGKFRYQAVRLMHLEREAIMAQDYARAMDINFKLRLNMELTRQSQELRDKTYGLARRAAKFCASKIHTPVCRYAVAFLGMKVGLMPGTKMIARTAQDKDLNMVKAWASEATDYGYTFEMDEELWFAELNPWRHMSLSYFDRVYRQLTQIMTIEQNMRKMDTWQGKVELEACVADLSNHILGNDPTRQKVGVESENPMVRKLKKFVGMQLTVGTRLRLWDDDKPLGKAWQLIMRPMADARADELRRFEKAAKQIRGIIGEAYSHEELMAMKDKAFDPALGESVSYEERLLVLLNLGNMGNKNRLMEGFRNVAKRTKWTQAEIDLMLAPLQKKDYDFAQKIWDHFEQYKKERFDQEEKLTGVRPIEVEASPLQTPFGTYRGGYFPIKYDLERGARAASYDKTNKSVNNMLPTVAHGAMKDRQEKGLGSPLKLTFSVITDAVAESVHDLAYRVPVIEVAKLLRQYDVQHAMEDTQGAMVYKQMWDWLNDLAGSRPAENSLDNIASWARSRMALFAMGFKVTTMLAQASGLLATTTQIGWKWTMRGVQDTFRHGGTWSARAVWEDTQARSVMMKNRMQSFDRDVLALTRDLTEAGSSNRFLDPLFRADDWVKKHAFTLTGWVQLWAADLPTWRGAFLKGLEELGMDEKEAAVYADNMVETAQGSGATKDLSELMRSDGMTQLLTVFFSYFNALFNMFYRSGTMAMRHKDLPHVAHLASMALVMWFVEPAVTAMLTNRGPAEDEDWKEWWLKEALQQPFQMIVGVRDIVNMIVNRIEGRFGSGYRFSPAADVIEAFGKTAIDLARLAENAGEDYDKAKKAAKSLARDIGMISGTPLLGAQMQTTLGNMWDWLDGTEEFELQDLFFARKK